MSDKPASRSDDALKKLSDAATPGKWGGDTFRKEIGPNMVTPLMSYQVRTARHTVSIGSENEADHAFVAALVNAYRAGELVVRSEQQRWIPVSERVPERQYDVMVSDGKFVGIGDCCKGHLWNATTIPGPVTHWMPLPASHDWR